MLDGGNPLAAVGDGKVDVAGDHLVPPLAQDGVDGADVQRERLAPRRRVVHLDLPLLGAQGRHCPGAGVPEQGLLRVSAQAGHPGHARVLALGLKTGE